MGSRGTRGVRRGPAGRASRSALRYALVAAAVLGLLAAAAWLGVKWADSDRVDAAARDAARVIEQAAAPGADWSGVLGELYRRQAAAFASGDGAVLSTVYAPGSTALAEDMRILQQYVAEGARPRGFGLVVQSVALREAGVGRAVLDAVDRRPAYQVLDSLGQVVKEFPARADTRFEITLVPAQGVVGEWRILTVKVLGAPTTDGPGTTPPATTTGPATPGPA